VDQRVRGPEQTAEVVERMQQEPVHECGDRNAGQRIEPGHAPARTVSIGAPGQSERGRHHEQVRLGGEVAEEPPYPDGVGRLDGTGIVPDPEPILDELQAQREGRDHKCRAEAEPGDSVLAH